MMSRDRGRVMAGKLGGSTVTVLDDWMDFAWDFCVC